MSSLAVDLGSTVLVGALYEAVAHAWRRHNAYRPAMIQATRRANRASHQEDQSCRSHRTRTSPTARTVGSAPYRKGTPSTAAPTDPPLPL